MSGGIRPDGGGILRFRRRTRDGGTVPLLTEGQAESIAQGLLAGEQQARKKAPGRPQFLYGAKGLSDMTAPQRAAIVRAARRNVNNRWTTGLVIAVPLAAFALPMSIWEGVIPEGLAAALPIVLFAPAIAIHAVLVRREIEALAARESARE